MTKPFPGNILLTTIPGIHIKASPNAVNKVESELAVQLDQMRHGPSAVEKTITHAYERDPVVLELLSRYLTLVTDMNRHMSGEDVKNQTLTEWPAS